MKIIENIVKVWPIYHTLESGKSNYEIPKELIQNYLFSDLVFFVILAIYDILVLPANFAGRMETAILIYVVIPTAINLGLFFLFYLLYLIGKVFANKHLGEKQWYIICGSLISTLICFSPAVFFKASNGSIILLVLPFIMASFFAKESWLIWSSVFSLISAGILCSGYINFGEWEITNITPGLNIMITLLCITFVFFVNAAMFFLKTVQTERSVDANNRNKAQTAFFLNMSHEIRTPINAILGLNEMISRDADNPDIINYSNDIKSAGDSLLTLVNNVLDFSKIESGKLELTEETYDFSELLRSSYLSVATKASAKVLDLKVMNDPDLPLKLYGDMGKIRQILINLLNNAIKYTNSGAVTLYVSGEKKSDESLDIIFKVEDTGVGIAKKDIERLFVQFERIDEKKNRNIEGTGLGLPLTKQLVGLMNGSIDVDSTVGTGSVFTVRLPQKISDSASVGHFNDFIKRNSVPEKYKPLFTAPQANILVVDDVKLNITIFYGLIKDTMVRVHVAYNGFEALKKAHEQKYDLIFMDHLMPEMDGIETLKKLRKEGLNTQTPVIVLTANAVQGLREEYLKEGFIDCLTKPISGVVLEKTILKYLPEELIEK